MMVALDWFLVGQFRIGLGLVYLFQQKLREVRYLILVGLVPVSILPVYASPVEGLEQDLLPVLVRGRVQAP